MDKFNLAARSLAGLGAKVQLRLDGFHCESSERSARWPHASLDTLAAAAKLRNVASGWPFSIVLVCKRASGSIWAALWLASRNRSASKMALGSKPRRQCCRRRRSRKRSTGFWRSFVSPTTCCAPSASVLKLTHSKRTSRAAGERPSWRQRAPVEHNKQASERVELSGMLRAHKRRSLARSLACFLAERTARRPSFSIHLSARSICGSFHWPQAELGRRRLRAGGRLSRAPLPRRPETRKKLHKEQCAAGAKVPQRPKNDNNNNNNNHCRPQIGRLSVRLCLAGAAAAAAAAPETRLTFAPLLHLQTLPFDLPNRAASGRAGARKIIDSSAKCGRPTKCLIDTTMRFVSLSLPILLARAWQT